LRLGFACFGSGECRKASGRSGPDLLPANANRKLHGEKATGIYFKNGKSEASALNEERKAVLKHFS
jgi:hypothetical protein